MRHQMIEKVTEDIARILHGKAAEKLTRDTQPPTGSPTPGPVRLYVLPVWAWGPSRTYVGRKDRSPDGGRLDMPIRLDWDVPIIGKVEDLPGGIATATTRSSGYRETVTVDVSATADSFRPSVTDLPVGVDWGTTDWALTTKMSPIARSHLLTETSSTGKTGYWSMMGRIEEHARFYIPKASASLAISAFGPEWRAGQQILDETTKALLISSFTLGTQDIPRSPAVRLIARCLEPRAFEKADPQMVMVKDVQRDVKEELRKVIGDPREGSAIRDTARSIGVPVGSFDEESVRLVVEAHNERFPDKTVGHRRVYDALSMVVNTTRMDIDLDGFEDLSLTARSMWG